MSDLVAPSIGWVGTGVAFCVQGGYGTPFLLELGLTADAVNYVWLAGPISGILAQPLVGTLSDRLGRRKPFILFGAITSFITMNIFANVKLIKDLDHSLATTNLAAWVAIITFWLSDFCINIYMAPLRTLVTDNISSHQQMDAMSWFSVFGGIGGVAAFGLGSITSNVRIIYFVGSMLIALSSIATMVMVRDGQTLRAVGRTDAIDRDKRSISRNSGQLLWTAATDIWEGIVQCPIYVWKLMLPQFLMGCACVPLWRYGTHFYGESIFHGTVTEDNEGSEAYNTYQKGVRYGNLALCISGVICLVTSWLIPKWFAHGTNYATIRLFWCVSYLMFGAFLCIAPYALTDNVTIFLIVQSCADGLSKASFHIFGWVFVSQYAQQFDPHNAGLMLSIFNLCQCFPQIVMSFITSILLNTLQLDIAALLFVGGVFGVLSALSLFFVDDKVGGAHHKTRSDDEQKIEMNPLISNKDDV